MHPINLQIRQINFTTKPCLRKKFFAFALFVYVYSFLPYCLGNSFL